MTISLCIQVGESEMLKDLARRTQRVIEVVLQECTGK